MVAFIHFPFAHQPSSTLQDCGIFHQNILIGPRVLNLPKFCFASAEIFSFFVVVVYGRQQKSAAVQTFSVKKIDAAHKKMCAGLIASYLINVQRIDEEEN